MSTTYASDHSAITNTPEGGLIVAVDGPSGTGKSTVCRAVATKLNASYLDTGAMYRVATLHVLNAGIDPTDSEAVIEATSDLPLVISDDPHSTEVTLDGVNVADDIRTARVTNAVSALAAIPEVRHNLVELQYSMAYAAGRCVVEGRDIGTVVLTQAPCKIFMTADAEVRAQRRYDQDRAAGRHVSFNQVLNDVQERDRKDSSRADSPLKPANDAVIIDTSHKSIDEVVDDIIEIVRQSAGDTMLGANDDSSGINSPTVSNNQPDEDPTLEELVFTTTEGHILGGESVIDSEVADHRDSLADANTGDVSPDITTVSKDDISTLLVTSDDNTDWQSVEEAFGVFDDTGNQSEALCTVAILGRPNVGKSTLVNRFIGRREAVVEDFPGVTRDRISYIGEWNGRRFWVQDTGGWDPDAKGMHAAIARQAESAMKTADVIVFVVDTQVGITASDEMLARKLHRADQPVILVANKFDSPTQYGDLAEFWALGLDNPYPVSAKHGHGAADVLDEVLRVFPDRPRQESITAGPRRAALVGKPNVGKSSLLNKMTGEDRAVVDDVAGTTVDPVDSLVELHQKTWTFVDTAGIRKKTKTASGHEYYAGLRTRGAIDAAEVVVFLVDASEPVTEQDQRVLRMILDSGRALVVAYNKWDLVDEDRRDMLDREIELQLAHIPWARRVNISAKTGRAIHKLEPAMIEALESWDGRVPTGQLNTWLRAVIAQTPPPMRGGRLPRVLFATQASTRPPVIVLFTTGFLEHGYRRFLERKFRETFGFMGSPVRIAVRVREKRTRK